MRFESNVRAAITDGLRKKFPAEISICLKFGDCIVSVKMNSEVLQTRLREYFGHFVVPAKSPDIAITVHETPVPDIPFHFTIKTPDPGKTKIKEEFAELMGGRMVRKRLTGIYFIFGRGDNLAIGPCVANVNQVINFINNRYIEWKLHKGGLLGHAAGVCLDQKGLALAGFSGMGKSTLALHMLTHGVDFVSNDRLMIMNSDPYHTDRPLTMFGVAKHPRINPGTALNNENLKDLIPEKAKSRYESLSTEQLWHLEEKYDAPVEMFFPKSRFTLSASMTGLFILNWQNEDSGPPVFEKIDIADRKDLLGAFMKSTGLFYHSPNGNGPADPTEDDYIQFLKNCDVVEIRGGVDFDAAARFGMEFLKNGGYPESSSRRISETLMEVW